MVTLREQHLQCVNMFLMWYHVHDFCCFKMYHFLHDDDDDDDDDDKDIADS